MCTTTTTTTSQNKSHQQTVYTAVPVTKTSSSSIRHQKEEQDDLESCHRQLFVDRSTTLTQAQADNEEHSWKQSSSCNFSLGMVTGMILSSAGFHFLLHVVMDSGVRHHHHSSDAAVVPLTTTQVLLFSALWSSSTYLIAYGLFSVLHYRRQQQRCSGADDDDDDDALVDELHTEKLECYFAVGVFSGFCLACAITDISYGLPARSVVLTLVIAAIWISVMAATSYWNLVVVVVRDDNESEQEEEVEETTKTMEEIDQMDREELRRRLLELVVAGEGSP